MPQINITGAQPGQPPKQPELTPEQKTLKALYDDRMQAQIKQLEQMRSIRRRSTGEEIADIKRLEAAQNAFDGNREKAMGKAVKGYANYTKIKTGLEHATVANMQQQDDAFERNREKAMGKAVKGFASYEKTKVGIEEAAYKKREADASAFDRNRDKALGKAVKGYANYEKQRDKVADKATRAAAKEAKAAEKQVLREQQAEKAQRHASARGWAGAARMGGIAMAGIHGDIEGTTTAIGTLLGSLGGPIGATIGAAAGEVLGKALKMAIEAPMLPGQAWQSYLSVSAPWMSLKSDAYSMARAGGYSGDQSIDSVLPHGSFGASQPQWMKNTGATPEGVLRSINATGIAPRSQDEFTSIAQTMAYAGNTGAYSNLRPGQIEGLAGQGMSLGMAAPGDSTKFLGAFAPIMTAANTEGLDKSKILAQIQETLDMMAKNGAAGTSAAGTTDAFMRFLAAGTPGGRSGADAAQSLGGTSAMLKNLTGSPGGMYGMMSVMDKQFNGLKTLDDAQRMAGDMPATFKGGGAFRAKLLQDAVDAANGRNGGNKVIAADIMAQAMDPDRVQKLIHKNVANMHLGLVGPYVQKFEDGSGSAALSRESDYGAEHPLTAASNGYDDQMAAQNFSGGTANDADTTRVLKNMGVPDAYIPMILNSAKQTGQDPTKIAAIMWHESRYRNGTKANPGMVNYNTDNDHTIDYGLGQTNSKWAAGDMAAAGITPQDLAGARAGIPLDPNRSIMATAMHLRGAGGDLVKYGGDNPTGRAAAAQEQDYISHHLTQNIPTDVNEAQAMGGAAVDTGAKDMFMNLNSAMKTVSSEAESAAVGINKLASAIRGLGDTGVNVKGPSEANNNWDAAGGNKISPVEMRTQHFHVQQ